MKDNLTLDQKIDAIVLETQRRVEWWISGAKIHCIPASTFAKCPTERIVELYRTEMEFFKVK